MPDVTLGRTIEKILSKVRKEKGSEIAKESLSRTISPLGSTGLESSTSSTFQSMPEKVYLKALPLRSIEDVNLIKQEVKAGNILIVRVSPLAKKSIDDVKRAVTELCDFTESVGGDIARLGEERVVITPSFVRIWREKADASESDSTVA